MIGGRFLTINASSFYFLKIDAVLDLKILEPIVSRYYIDSNYRNRQTDICETEVHK